MAIERTEEFLPAHSTLTRDANGQPLDAGGSLQDLLQWARVADAAGLDDFRVMEHHRAVFAVSAPPVVLSAAAAQTTRIRLTSTVTVLSSADPVRVFEDFATMDLISSGRAEIAAGRSAYIESFPLGGKELERYDEYFEDRLDLLLKIRDQNPVSWRGITRAALDQLGVWPRRAVPCSPAARTRSWRKSCGNTMCWAMPASWPRCGWAGCPRPRR